MKKVNKKKGFTLAELLVVIAILAILVAVAVPIFTGVLGDAQDKVDNANVRAIRAAAVTKILSDPTIDVTTGEWTATAKVTDTGDIDGDLNIATGISGTEGVAADGTVTAHIHSLD